MTLVADVEVIESFDVLAVICLGHHLGSLDDIDIAGNHCGQE